MAKTTPNSNDRIEAIIENESCSITCEPHIKLKNSPLWPQEVKNHPKIKTKSNDRIEGNIENQSCFTIWVDPKAFFETDPNLQNIPFGPQRKAKTTIK